MIPQALEKMPAIALALLAAGGSEAFGALQVSPNPIPADKPATVMLLGLDADCRTRYTRDSAFVSGRRIDLHYTPTFVGTRPAPDPDSAICALMGAQGGFLPVNIPVFGLPALAAGTYEVWATEVPECVYQGCEIATVTVSAGTLRVESDAPRTGWYLKERTAAAASPFTMQLLRSDLGSCGTTFSHATANVVRAGGIAAPGIYASFVMETRPDAVCIQDQRPYGPAFAMPALDPGVYPVIPVQRAACEVLPEPCLLDRVVPTVPTDTLVVIQTVAVRLSELRARAPRTEVRGDVLVFALPESRGGGSGPGAAGSWRAALVTPDGRLWDQAPLRGAPGDEVTFTLRNAPAGFGLLRLTSPDGTHHLLPVSR